MHLPAAMTNGILTLGSKTDEGVGRAERFIMVAGHDTDEEGESETESPIVMVGCTVRFGEGSSGKTEGEMRGIDCGECKLDW